MESVSTEDTQEKIGREWEIVDESTSLKQVEFEIYLESNPQKKARIVLLLSRALDF